MVTAVKGGATEAAQSVVDGQTIRILEQEIREAKDELRKSDHARTQILAKCKLSEQKVSGLEKSIAEYEAHARKAVDTDRQSRWIALRKSLIYALRQTANRLFGSISGVRKLPISAKPKQTCAP